MVAADETAIVSTAAPPSPAGRKHAAAAALETRAFSAAHRAAARTCGRGGDGGRGGGGGGGRRGQRCGGIGAASYCGEPAALGTPVVVGVGEIAVVAPMAPRPAAVGRAQVNLRKK